MYPRGLRFPNLWMHICYFPVAQTNRKHADIYALSISRYSSRQKRNIIITNKKYLKKKRKLYMHNTIGDVALTNSRETNCYHDFEQYQK